MSQIKVAGETGKNILGAGKRYGNEKKEDQRDVVGRAQYRNERSASHRGRQQDQSAPTLGTPDFRTCEFCCHASAFPSNP